MEVLFLEQRLVIDYQSGRARHTTHSEQGIRTKPTSSSRPLAKRWARPGPVACSSLAPPPPPATPAGSAWGRSCCCATTWDSRTDRWCSATTLRRRATSSWPAPCRHPLALPLHWEEERKDKKDRSLGNGLKSTRVASSSGGLVVAGWQLGEQGWVFGAVCIVIDPYLILSAAAWTALRTLPIPWDLCLCPDGGQQLQLQQPLPDGVSLGGRGALGWAAVEEVEETEVAV